MQDQAKGSKPSTPKNVSEPRTAPRINQEPRDRDLRKERFGPAAKAAAKAHQKGEKPVSQLIEDLGDTAYETREQAALQLSKRLASDPEKILPALTSALLSSEDIEVIRRAESILSNEAESIVAWMAEDGDRALARMPAPGNHSGKQLADMWAIKKTAFVQSIQQGSLTTLKGLSQGRNELRSCTNILQAMAQTPEQLIKAVRPALASEDEMEKSFAALALGSLGAKAESELPKLIEMASLTDYRALHRTAAALALSDIAPTRAATQLLEAASQVHAEGGIGNMTSVLSSVQEMGTTAKGALGELTKLEAAIRVDRFKPADMVIISLGRWTREGMQTGTRPTIREAYQSKNSPFPGFARRQFEPGERARFFGVEPGPLGPPPALPKVPKK